MTRRIFYLDVLRVAACLGVIAETFAATTIASFAAVHLMSYLPWAEYIAGYRRR